MNLNKIYLAKKYRKNKVLYNKCIYKIGMYLGDE